MGMKDQFQEKSEQMKQQAKRKMEQGKQRGQQHGQQSPERGRHSESDTRRLQEEAEDRFDQDYDA